MYSYACRFFTECTVGLVDLTETRILGYKWVRQELNLDEMSPSLLPSYYTVSITDPPSVVVALTYPHAQPGFQGKKRSL
jgi:hypothetical protein